MVAVVDLEYIAYRHRDLDRAEAFFTDFGMKRSDRSDGELLMRGCSSHQYCYVATEGEAPGLQAIALRVADAAALEEAARLPEASQIEAIDRPGGGYRVRLTSPDGLPFELVHGIASVDPMGMRDPLTYNHARSKARKGTWQRPDLEPAAVLRLGHVAILTPNYRENAAWLASRFAMAPSDVLFDNDQDNQIGGFFHCTAAEGWTDHHTLALFPAPVSKVHHCSFEVQDIDAQFLSNKYLNARGWTPLWGVGRHILGSQVFDYWFDPEGNVVEHFTDGDLVLSGRTPEFHQVSDDSLAQWGPPMPVGNFIERIPFSG
ncbi:VOC family protein [Sphingobium sp.]|uniref:VOC family protein n=1 Tax=Sphingobium sp. TaxID=1912891 RepID=UPI0028BF05A2|nr:VOC family protein [Sphingobium sp.]